MNESIFKHGEFFIGCNYWASHAGTNMWHDWRPEVIENDFKLLSSKNVKYLRIFPLWPDFQPIKMHRGGGGCDKEIRMGEDPLPFTEAGRAGVSELMCERFQYFCDLAEKYGAEARDYARANRDFRAFGGENTEMQTARLLGFLEKPALYGCDRVALFCHAGLILCMQQIATECRWYSGDCDNGSVSVFESEDGAQWKMKHWNITGEI